MRLRTDERGEVASWLILMAGLVAAAVAASTVMQNLTDDLAQGVVAAANGETVGGDGNPGDGNPGDGEPGDGSPFDGEPGDGDPDDPDEDAGPGGRAAQAPPERQALFAIDSYNDEAGDGVPDGWTRIDPDNLPQEMIDAGITEEHLHNGWTGYDAAVYQSDDGEYVVAFRGTDGGFDHLTNVPQNDGEETSQYRTAVDLVRRMKTVAPEGELSVTGHSLGGGLASVAALANEVPATTYDPAGIHPNTLARHGADPDRAEEFITGYYVDGEILSNDVVPVQVLRVWTRNEMEAPIGDLNRLPAVDPDGNVLGPIVDPGPLPEGATIQEHLEWREAMARFRDEGTRRHGTDWIIRGLGARTGGN